MPVKGLRGLPGLNTLSDEERQAFMLANEDQLKQFKKYRDRERAAELLFNNQQFVNKFGRDKFDAAVKQGISYEDRNNKNKKSNYINYNSHNNYSIQNNYNNNMNDVNYHHLYNNSISNLTIKTNNLNFNNRNNNSLNNICNRQNLNIKKVEKK